MAIDGIGNRTTFLASYLVDARKQMEDLQQQLATGKKATTYAGMGDSRGFAVGLRAQLVSLQGFGDTITNVDSRINIASSALQRMADLGSTVKGAALNNITDVDTNGLSVGQTTAMSSLAEMVQLLNTQSGDRYLFSGRATDTPAVASLSDILDGNGARAGLKQVIAERRQADLGTTGMGRLAVGAPSATSVSVAEDVAGSPFGMKIVGATTTVSGATITGPSGSPPSLSVDLGATNPNAGEKFQVTFTMPDGTSETLTLTATTTNPPPEGSFLIGANSAATSANLQTALTSGISKLANTALVAASAFAASDNFFSEPPLRVSGPPFDTATSLVAGTNADTVMWYTGETGIDPARGTALARVDQSIAVSYGVRADEEGIRSVLKNLATYALVATPSSDPNAKGQANALNQRAAANLSTQSTGQSISDILAELAGAQSAIHSAKDRHTQTNAMLQSMLDTSEGISQEEVATKILALQTSLQASYQTTSMLYKTSLVNYL